MTTDHSTIAAPASGTGGAIALIRLSGPDTLAILDSVFSRPLAQAEGYTIHFGTIRDGEQVLDEVLVSVFRAPRSYTGEDMAEISCHGSSYIVREILALLVRKGAVAAGPGEFTQRAFLNGKLDLSQAEAVADLIASESAAAHRVALHQMRGGYAGELAGLREKLLNITALLELELDFSEEDVEFADRGELHSLLTEILDRCRELAASFRTGSALKEGIPVAIAGEPNTGKSTLLNRLLGEERAIVSEIAGTTRDFIEETFTTGGVLFRLIDTAGLRHTTDTIESIGIERTRERIAHSRIVLLLASARYSAEEIVRQAAELNLGEEQKLIVILNKSDLYDPALLSKELSDRYPVATISAKQGEGIEPLKNLLLEQADIDPAPEGLVVSNARHYEALVQAAGALERSLTALDAGLPADLVSEDIREVLDILSTITGGRIDSEEVLGHIFSRFCIGK